MALGIRRHCFVIITAFLLSNSIFARANPAIWEIQGQKNTVFLFGSIHVANQSLYPLGEKIDKAFRQADVLVVEVDEAKVDQFELQQLMASRGFYQGTETIRDHIDTETFQMLQGTLKKSGIPYLSVARMKPGILAMTLTVTQVAQLGYLPELGIDRYFMKQAQGRKEIQQLETMEEQVDLLLSFSDDNLLLRHTLISLDKTPQIIDDLMSAWSDGNLDHLEKLLLEDQLKKYPEFKPVIERLIYNRNVTMAVKIQQMLKDNRDYFVVVGVAHLAGDRGIVSILRKNEFAVKRLQ